EDRPGGLARRLGISRDTVRRWLRAGWLATRRDAEGHHVSWADASELRRLRALHRLPRTWATKDRLAELKQPKPRPERSSVGGPAHPEPGHPTVRSTAPRAHWSAAGSRSCHRGAVASG